MKLVNVIEGDTTRLLVFCWTEILGMFTYTLMYTCSCLLACNFTKPGP